MNEAILIGLKDGKIERQDAYRVITAVAEKKDVRIEGEHFYLNMTPGKKKRYILRMGTPEINFYEALRDIYIVASAYYLVIGGYRISYKEE